MYCSLNLFFCFLSPQHDLIYTFFHPMLKDEQDFDKTDVLKLRGINIVSKISRLFMSSCLLFASVVTIEFYVLIFHSRLVLSYQFSERVLDSWKKFCY